MASKGPPTHSAATDLGALWTKAVDDYMKKTKRNMSHMRAQNMGEVMKKTEKSMVGG